MICIDEKYYDYITGENEASNNGIIIAVTVVGVLISVALVASAIIIRQKKLKCTYYETDHKANISEEIPEYADVQLRSTAVPLPPLTLPPPPPQMSGTNAKIDPDVDRNPAYGHLSHSAIS